MEDALRPVDLSYLPSPTGEAEAQRPLVAVVHRDKGSLDVTNFFPAVLDPHDRRRTKHGVEFEEVLSTIQSYAELSQRQQPIGLVQDLPFEHGIVQFLKALLTDLRER